MDNIRACMTGLVRCLFALILDMIMRNIINRGVWLAGLLWGLWLVSPAVAQDGLTYRGEIALHLKTGDTLLTDRIGVAPRYVRAGRMLAADKYDTELIDHIEITTNRGEYFYLVPFETTKGLLIQRTVPTWMMRQWETYRIEFFKREELQYQSGGPYSMGHTTRVITYYYRKDGGPMRLMNGKNVLEDVLDDPLSVELAQRAQVRQQLGNTMQNGGVIIGLGMLAYTVLVEPLDEQLMIGTIIGSLAMYFGGSLVQMGTNGDLEKALNMYEGAIK